MKVKLVKFDPIYRWKGQGQLCVTSKNVILAQTFTIREGSIFSSIVGNLGKVQYEQTLYLAPSCGFIYNYGRSVKPDIDFTRSNLYPNPIG